MALLDGKIGLVFGVANKNSIAWAVAQAWHREGVRLVFTYQGERFKDKVAELVFELDGESVLLPCDVTKDEEIDAVFASMKERFGRCDLLLHAVAYAPREAMAGEFIGTSRDAFRMAQDISAYSLVALARGISGFHTMLDYCEEHSPLKRNVLPEELGNTAAFLASDGAAAITGQVVYVDCGYSIMGM